MQYKNNARMSRAELLALAAAAVVASSAILATVLNFSAVGLALAATSGTSNVLASANVIASCFISISDNQINFGNVPAGGDTSTTLNAITVNDPFGNAPANIFLSGTSWNGPLTANFQVTNTLWASADVTLSSATELTNTFVDTAIQIAAPNTVVTSPGNLVYFGANVPKVMPTGVYTQNIFVENQC